MNSIDEKPKKEVLNFAKKGDFGVHIPRFGVLVLKCSSYSAVFL
jgi:hypothetical protein